MNNERIDVSKFVNRFRRFDRVRVRQGMGVSSGNYGTIISVGGDNGTYYGVKCDTWPEPMGFSEYELEAAFEDQLSRVQQMASGSPTCQIEWSENKAHSDVLKEARK